MTDSKKPEETPAEAETPTPTLELEAVTGGRADASDYVTGSDPFGIKAALSSSSGGGGGGGGSPAAHESVHVVQQTGIGGRGRGPR